MNRVKVMSSALVFTAALAGVVLLAIGTAEAQTVAFKRTVYSAKFLCGTYRPAQDAMGITREGPVKPGNYQTAINIVNPTRKPITFVKKAVLLFNDDPGSPVPTPGTFEEPQAPGQRYSAHLEPNWGMEIDCPDIRNVLLQQGPPTDPAIPLPFIKGYVVLETFKPSESLDVVTAHTSHGFRPREEGVCIGGANPGAPCDTDVDCGSGGVCDTQVVGVVPEGFSVDVEKVKGEIAP